MSVFHLTKQTRALAVETVQNAPEGHIVSIREPNRTLEQNATLWRILTAFSKQLEWPVNGQMVKLEPEDWKDMFTASLRKARVVPGLDPGSFVPLGMRTSDMSKDEMTALLDLIDAFAAQHSVALSDQKEIAA